MSCNQLLLIDLIDWFCYVYAGQDRFPGWLIRLIIAWRWGLIVSWQQMQPSLSHHRVACTLLGVTHVHWIDWDLGLVASYMDMLLTKDTNVDPFCTFQFLCAVIINYRECDESAKVIFHWLTCVPCPLPRTCCQYSTKVMFSTRSNSKFCSYTF